MGELMTRVFGGDLTHIALIPLVVLGVITFVVGLRYLLAPPDLVSARLQRLVATDGLVGPSVQPGTRRHRLLSMAMAPFARLARPADDTATGLLRKQLIHAGYRSENALAIYLGTRVLLATAAAAVVMTINFQRAQPLRFTALWTLGAMAVAFYLPAVLLAGRVRERQRELNHALPDALDLLVSCVEAGLGLDSALNRVVAEIKLSSPRLADELSRSSMEMRAGMTRGEAFRGLADRTGIDELRNLAAIIVQTEIFGTSVARSLRVQADAMRIRRTQLAEERAATVSVKLTVPLIFCILPALFAVLVGPAAVKIMNVLLPTLTGAG
jgi:tight adherence protein C